MNTVKTAGTKAAIYANAVVGVLGILQGMDWVSLVGSSTAGWVALGVAVANGIAHQFTGNG